ncbi:MAG: sugar transferase [Chloroflexi bacterium]|nr:sugar transferase [Chloroflexota bacterium]
MSSATILPSSGAASRAVESRPRGRRRRLLAGLAWILVDFILINVAFWLAWWLRYEQELGRGVAEADYLPWGVYLPIQFGLSLALPVVYGAQRLYSRRGRDNLVDDFGVILWGTLVGVALTIVAVFYFRPFGYSRLVFIYAIASIVALLASARLLTQAYRTYQWRHGRGLIRVLVIGAGAQGRLIIQNIVAQPHLGLRIVGFVDDERATDLGRVPYLGPAETIPDLVAKHEVDEVIIALPSASHAKIAEILLSCAERRLDVRIVPDFYQLRLNQVDIEPINGIPLIGLRDVSLRESDLLIKRVLGLVGAAGSLVLFAPLMLAIALAIRLDSAGPVVVRQTRIGRGGKPFPFFKFRSMRVGAERELDKLMALNEASGPIFKMRNDPRLTRVGRILRRLSLDELPQLYNVLRGEMSLVGPRPGFPFEVERYEEWHRRRLEVSPGITGLWQVSGRSDIPFDEMALLDIWYIENWSLTLDLKILVRTVPAVLFGVGAY